MSKKRHGYRNKVRVSPGATLSPVNPAFGGMGPSTPGLSPSVAPPTPGTRQGSGHESKYTQNPGSPTPYVIEDVDLANWFSPLQPVVPFGPPQITHARDWDYPTGLNIDYIPARLRMFQVWRGMAETWGVLRAVIETRKDQVIRLPWEFQVRGKPRARNKWIDDLKEKFAKPDGKRSFNTWLRLLLEDLFVIDAPALYLGNKNRGGQPMSMDVLDGATIKPLIDDAGRIPDAPQPAYQQIIKGMPMVNMDERDLMYKPMRPRTQNPIFGYSPVEQIYIEITEAIRKTYYQLNFWVEGNLPDMIMSVPENWTARQIAQFQALMDANLSGNLQQKSKIRFVPHGMQPYDIKNASGQDTWATRDEMLIRLVCYVFSVSPQPFIKQMNRATAQSANEEAQQEGLYPLVSYLTEDIMNPLIHDHFGYDEIDWVVLPQQEVDQLKRSQVYVNYAKAGLQTINEIRDDMGKPPVKGGDEVLIYTNNGVMTLQDAIAAGKLAATAAPDGASAPADVSGANPGPSMANPRGTQERNPPANPKVAKDAPIDSSEEGLETGTGGAQIVPLFK